MSFVKYMVLQHLLHTSVDISTCNDLAFLRLRDSSVRLVRSVYACSDYVNVYVMCCQQFTLAARYTGAHVAALTCTPSRLGLLQAYVNHSAPFVQGKNRSSTDFRSLSNVTSTDEKNYFISPISLLALYTYEPYYSMIEWLPNKVCPFELVIYFWAARHCLQWGPAQK